MPGRLVRAAIPACSLSPYPPSKHIPGIRIPNIVRLLTLCALISTCCAETWSAPRPKYRPRQTPIRVDARDVERPPLASRSFGIPVNVGASLVTPGTQIGNTWYDWQHNGSMGRQVDEAGGRIQASWMKGPGPSDVIRTVGWNRVTVGGSPEDFMLADGSVIRILPLLSGLLTDQMFTAARPGYTNLRNRPGGEAVVIFHDAPLAGLQLWEAHVDLFPGAGLWRGIASEAPQPVSPEYDSDAIIWPKSAISVCGTDTILHAVGTWSGAANECWYWRGVIDGTTGSIAWDVNQPTMIDPQDAFVTSVVEAHGDTVYIVMAKQINPVNADLVYYRSVDCGVSWGPMVNVSNFTVDGPEGLFAELNAVIDEGGELHVIYNTVPFDGQDSPTYLFHWSPTTGAQLITTAAWHNSCVGGGLYGPWCGGNGSGSTDLAVADMSLAVKPAGLHGIADELLYAVWTQYGPTDSDCATVDDQGTLGGCVNGEIYCSVSSTGGLTWDRPQNLTGTETPDCDPGDCYSEAWVSVAARADSAVYISYVEDRHAGPIVLGQGVWTDNPYRIMAPETRLPVPEPVIAVTPLEYIELNADPTTGIPDSVQLTVYNVGTAQLDYFVDVTADNGGLSHVLVNGATSYSGSISPGGSEALAISFHTTGLLDPSEHIWRLEITSNDLENDPGQGGSPLEVILRVFAASIWHECTEDTLSTGLHRMQVSSCLEMGDNGLEGSGFYNYIDSSDGLVSGSPVITLVRPGGDTVAYHNALMTPSDRTRALNKSFRAQSEMQIARDESVTVGDSTYVADRAWGQASTTDTTIGIDYEMVFPKSPDLGRGAFWKFAMKSLTGAPITGVSYGVVADVDVVSAFLGGSPYENAGDANCDLNWIAGRGGQADTLAGFLPINQWFALFHLPPDGRCRSAQPAAAQVLGNANYVHPEQGFNTDSLYMLFNTFGHLGGWGTNIHIDTGQQYGDVSLLLVDGYDATLDPVTDVQWGYGVAVSDISRADLDATVTALCAVANAACQVVCPITLPGDVNITGNITSADIIYLVSFVFKSTDEPLPCEAS